MKVSVIIPCYNVEKHVEKAVTSALDQTYSDIEIICINDGSTDKTLEVLEKLKAKKGGGFTILNQENKGASAARNKGIENAKGGYFQFLDGDDYLLDNKIKVQMQLAKKTNYPSIIVGGCKAYDEDNNFLFDRKYKKQETNSIWLMLLQTNLGNTCSNLFKSDYFNQGGRWDINMKSSQDYNMMFDMLKFTNRIVFDDQLNTILVRRTSDSISHINVRENWIRHIKLRERILSYIKAEKINVPIQKAHQIVFDAIRIFYRYDKELAYSAFVNIIPKGFTPQVSSTTGKMYVFLYKLLGFKKTEFFKSLFRRVRQQKISYG